MMMRRSFTWQFQRKQRRRQSRHRLKMEPLSHAGMGRVARLEAVEPRLLLTHAAPLLNPLDTPHFNSVQENTPVGSNGGESVINMLQTGGAIVGNLPASILDYSPPSRGRHTLRSRARESSGGKLR